MEDPLGVEFFLYKNRKSGDLYRTTTLSIVRLVAPRVGRHYSKETLLS